METLGSGRKRRDAQKGPKRTALKGGKMASKTRISETLASPVWDGNNHEAVLTSDSIVGLNGLPLPFGVGGMPGD